MQDVMTDPVTPQTIDYERLRRRLERAVARYWSPSLDAQRDDVVQAAMLRMMNVIEKAGPSASFSGGYLMRTLYTVTMDEIRAVARRSEVPLDDGARGPEPTSHRTNPERERISRELGEEILDCLSRLVRPRRAAVALYLLGNSGPESSRMLSWSPKKVNNLVYRGLADLRKCLEMRGVTP